MKFKKGDFLHIPTVGEYRCLIADEEVAVFVYPDKYSNMNTFIRKQDGSYPQNFQFDESDMIEFHEDIAHIK